MIRKTFLDKCPFRDGTASKKIFVALATSKKPLALEQIAAKAKVSQDKARTLVAAYMNPFHNAPLRRVGVAVSHGKDGYSLSGCKADAKAKRPERGKKATKRRARMVKEKKTSKPRKAVARKAAEVKPTAPAIAVEQASASPNS